MNTVGVQVLRQSYPFHTDTCSISVHNKHEESKGLLHILPQPSEVLDLHPSDIARCLESGRYGLKIWHWYLKSSADGNILTKNNILYWKCRLNFTALNMCSYAYLLTDTATRRRNYRHIFANISMRWDRVPIARFYNFYNLFKVNSFNFLILT